jgi:hypothetical protein
VNVNASEIEIFSSLASCVSKRRESHHQGGSRVGKAAGDMVQFPPPFFLVVTGSNPLAVIVREPDATKKGLYQLVLWWGYGDGLAFSGSNYGSNRIFYNGWKPRWSHPRGKITLIAHFPPF